MEYVTVQETLFFFFLVVVGGGGGEKQIEAAGINMQLIVLFAICDRSWFWSADITHMFCMKEHYA